VLWKHILGEFAAEPFELAEHIADQACAPLLLLIVSILVAPRG